MKHVTNQQIIVGIGASAGGFESFKELLSRIPSNTGLAFVFVQHMDPSHESMSAQLLAHYTQMEVKSAQNKMKVEPNCVYVIPSNKLLRVDKGQLRLDTLPKEIKKHKTINYFLESLAKDKKENAIGIVLSGTGDDGLVGCTAIQENGGLVIAEDPAKSEFASMPQHIVDAGIADYVLPLKEIPSRILDYLKERPDPKLKTEKGASESLSHILTYLKVKTKNDFSSYKKATLLRRIHRRMDIKNIQHMNQYLLHIKDNPLELEALLKDLLIKMTSFFRNPESFKELMHKVQVLPTKEFDTSFRVWVPGCATGEEVYSLTIALMEQASLSHKKLQIFATDIDEEALEFARQGIYPKKIKSQIPPKLLEKYFEQKGESYHIKKIVRSKILFTVHNVIRDTPFSKLDLISCRNLFIYLEAEMQKEILGAFHFSLKENGLLFLGNAENIGREDHLFETVSKKHRIFKRKEILSTAGNKYWLRKHSPIVTHPISAETPTTRQRNLFEQFKQQLAEEYIPASVLINERFDVLYFLGSLSRFLKIPQGTPNLNLLSLMRGSLPAKLKKSIPKIMEDKTQPITGFAYIPHGKVHYWVEFKMSFLKKAFEQDLFTITFREAQQEGPNENEHENGGTYVENLTEELANTKKHLQSTIESLEQTNEDLKISNEEIMSMNEELQAANEELETSKEELQSLNEELTVVNAQLQEKIETQERTNDDLVNLIKSTDIATIFLDQETAIKRFTPDTTKFFNFRETDIGRPIGDITMRFTDSNLMPDIKDVLEKHVSIEREIKTKDNEWFLRKIVSYKTIDEQITGVVITFANVTSIKGAQELLKKSEEKLTNILDSLPVQIAYVDQDLKYRFNNKLYANRSGLSPQELFGQPINAVDLKTMKPYIQKVLSGEEVKFDDTLTASRYGEVILIPDINQNGEPKGFFILNSDVTDKKQAAIALERANEKLEEKVSQRTEELQAEISCRKAAEANLLLANDFLKAVIEAVPDPIYVRDQNQRILVANKAFYDTFNKKENEVINHKISEIYSPQELKKIGWSNKNSFKTSYPQIKFEKNNQIYFVKKAVFSSQDNHKYLVCSFQNITKILESEKKLEKTIKKLKLYNDELKHFAYLCSHDLQEPIRTIANFTNLLSEHVGDLIDDERKQYLSFIIENANRMHEMIKGALSYAKITSAEPHIQSVDVNEMIDKITQSLHTAIEEVDANITHDELPVVRASSINLSLVFQNLISNALKFRGSDKAHIHISGKKDKSGYVFSVKDNGIGIDKAHKGKLFDLFRRLNKDKYPGSGIGLSICNKLVIQWGGKLWVESKPGDGSTFYFTLPQKVENQKLRATKLQ